MKLYENAACIINVWGCTEILPTFFKFFFASTDEAKNMTDWQIDHFTVL